MRVVADTNTVISGLLWNGLPRAVLERAQSGADELFTSPDLLAELEDVLSRRKLSRRLTLARTSALELVLGYAALARVVHPLAIEPIVLADPDDDAVFACAFAARAEVIVSGDEHLLALRQIRGVHILTARGFLEQPSPGG
jgi:putative PIN family toxin of toxin-antitoxin system